MGLAIITFIFVTLIFIACFIDIGLTLAADRYMSEKDIAKMSDDKKRFAIKCLSEFKRPMLLDEFKIRYEDYLRENEIATQKTMDLDKSRKMVRFINESLHRGDVDE